MCMCVCMCSANGSVFTSASVSVYKRTSHTFINNLKGEVNIELYHQPASARVDSSQLICSLITSVGVRNEKSVFSLLITLELRRTIESKRIQLQ